MINRGETGEGVKRSGEMRCLRRRELKKVFTTYIGASRPQCVGILGVRRSGRSSFLKFIANPDIQRQYLDNIDDFVIIFIEAQRNYLGEVDFLHHLFSVIGTTGRGDGRVRFADWIKTVSGQQRRAILLIDDFHHLSQNANIKLDFYSYMRSMANEFPLGLLVTGPKDLYSSVADPALAESPFFNIFNTLNLDTLSPNDCREFLIEEMAGDQGENDAVATWILERAGCYPYTLQVLSDLVAEAGSRALAGDEKTALSVISRFKNEIADFIIEIYDELQDNLKQRFAQRMHNPKSVGLSHSELHQLMKAGLLASAGDSYDLTSPVFEEILKERIPPPR